jgi:hypothetical protein
VRTLKHCTRCAHFHGIMAQPIMHAAIANIHHPLLYHLHQEVDGQAGKTHESTDWFRVAAWGNLTSMSFYKC